MRKNFRKISSTNNFILFQNVLTVVDVYNEWAGPCIGNKGKNKIKDIHKQNIQKLMKFHEQSYRRTDKQKNIKLPIAAQ